MLVALKEKSTSTTITTKEETLDEAVSIYCHVDLQVMQGKLMRFIFFNASCG